MLRRHDCPTGDETPEVPIPFQPPSPTLTDARLRRAEKLRKELDALRQQLAELLGQNSKSQG
jgi:hypothetical protein